MLGVQIDSPMPNLTNIVIDAGDTARALQAECNLYFFLLAYSIEEYLY